MSANNGDVVRVAAVADVHCGKESQGTLAAGFASVNEAADVLVLCGDLTDYGTPEEARVLAKELAAVRIPMLGVLGNHDYEGGSAQDVCTILHDAGVRILDGEVCEVRGVGFAGVKGFCGGFGARALAPWGEGIIKQFVREAVDEALKLESALARLRMASRIALLHYSPIEATVAGEPCEIVPFLGSSRLEDPFTRYPVAAVVHGHAHRGQPEGRTRNGIPVYNVARKVLDRTFPGGPPYRVIEISPDESSRVIQHAVGGADSE